MRIITLLALLQLTSCFTLNTKQLILEVRVDKKHPRLDSISIVGKTMSSSTGLSKILKSDEDYYYYQFDSIVEPHQKCVAIFEFASNRDGKAVSEIYDLKKSGLFFRRNWSHWLMPDSTFSPSDGLGLGSWYSIAHGSTPTQGRFPFPPRTSIRYRIQNWQ